MTNINIYRASLVLVITLCFAANPKYNRAESPPSNPSAGNLNKIGDHGYPSNPMNDRAIGYLFKGKAKSAVTNYGEFIEWDVHPAGLWGNYAYLPDVAFVTGVPGQSYSYRYTWYTNSTNTACPESTIPGTVLWLSLIHI